MRCLAMVVLALATMTPLMAQVATRATASVTCSVRIRSRAAADYDPSAELVLSGTVVSAQAGSLRLRLAAGTVRVDLGSAVPAVTLGENVAVTVSRLQNENGQHFVARELHAAAGDQIFRDADGVPVS